VQRLAETETQLPPIVVHRSTMNVVDGVHRVRAAALKGEACIRARFFEGSEEEAFLFAVSVNTAHGLPLTMADRVAAARRILASHPSWSDRAVAAVAGLSTSKVAKVRNETESPSAGESVTARVGRDGRSRPLDPASGRRYAGELFRSDPGASLRQVAFMAGISPATAADVRDRLRRGVDPVPEKQRALAPQARGHQPEPPRAAVSGAELRSMLDQLRRDPSLRFNQAGRDVLRLLTMCTITDEKRQQILATLPEHCTGQLATLMNGYAELLRSLGEDLERTRGNATRRPA